MPLDLKKYRRLARTLHLSEPEQDELIQELWNFLDNIVDHAFQRHPLQQCDRAFDTHLQDPLESLESKADQPIEQAHHSGPPSLEQRGPS